MSDEQEKPDENKTIRKSSRKKATAKPGKSKKTTPPDAAADATAGEKSEEKPAAKKPPMPELRAKSSGKRRRRVVPWVAAALLIIGVLGINFTDPAPETPTGPTIGGAFSLIDTTGATVTDADFRGRFMLVYFGYTYCPDICPTTLSTMAEAIDMLGADGNQVVPVFITIDPGRDSPEHLKEYVGFFHPRQVGLTGTADQVAAVAKAYGVFYAKDPAHDATPHNHGPATGNNAAAADAHDYDMEHAATLYLMGPKGAFRARFDPATRAPEMAERIQKFL